MSSYKFVWYAVQVIFTFQVAVGENKPLSFRDCSSDDVYNVDDQTSYTLEWSDDFKNFNTFTCKFRGYKQSEDNNVFFVCINATTWDIRNNSHSYYDRSQPDDIKMEYFTYSQTKNNKFGDGWHISSTKKTFYQRPWLDDQFDPTETWCEGKKSESDEIVGIQLIVRPGSSERRIVLNITGKAGPEDHFALILGLSLGTFTVVTSTISVAVIICCYMSKKRMREQRYRDEYQPCTMTADRSIGRQDSFDNSNLTERSEINRVTPTAPPPTYDDIFSEDIGTKETYQC